MRKLLITMGVLVLLGAGGCARQATVEDAFTAAEEAADQAASADAKLEIAKRFLQEYPDTKYTARMVGEASSLLVDDLKRPADAEALIKASRERVKDAKTARKLAVQHVEVLGKLGKADDLAAVAAPLAGDVDLSFYDQISVAEAAIEAKGWDTALMFAGKAAEITAEQLKAMSPGRYASQADLDRGVNKRKAWALSDVGWAQANLGQTEVALATFEKANGLDSKQLPGNSETSLPVYWSRTLLKTGKAREAADVVAANALYGGDKDAAAVLEEAWKAQALPGEYQAYLDDLRERMARPAPDFTLPDYEGKPQTFAALRSGEVTLLAFWFPT